MVNVNTTFLHDLFQILIGNGIAKIEVHSKKNDFLWKMLALETNHYAALDIARTKGIAQMAKPSRPKSLT